MGKTLDLGRRIELQPTDKHGHDISLGLYMRQSQGAYQVLVHTYSSADGAKERVAFMRRALIEIAGLEEAATSPWLQFPCKTLHERAVKRAFLDLCKLETGTPLEPKPLTAFDKKADADLTAKYLDDGIYEMQSPDDVEAGPRRAAALARGFAKICEMDTIDDGKNQVAFPCKMAHDPMMGLLMFRAQNVRAAMQEEEMSSGRGVLSSPSQQK